MMRHLSDCQVRIKPPGTADRRCIQLRVRAVAGLATDRLGLQMT